MKQRVGRGARIVLAGALVGACGGSKHASDAAPRIVDAATPIADGALLPDAPTPDAPPPFLDDGAPRPDAPPRPDASPAPPDASLCPTPGTVPGLKLTEVATGLTEPIYVTQAPGDPNSLYVVEKPGRIQIIRGGAKLATPFLDISAIVNVPVVGAEGGLLSMVFAADYAVSGRFWVDYTQIAIGAAPPHVAVTEFHRSAANPDVADPTPVVELFAQPHNAFNHAAGMLAFGKDGFLYASIGDAAQHPSSAPDITVTLGKILRLDVNHPGVVPAGNVPGGGFVWDYGLRNPWRFSFDRKDGTMYIADPGEDSFEEIDVEPVGMGHRDYGWDHMEATHCFPPGTVCTPSGTLPIVEEPHPNFIAIIGGYVYRGAKIPCLEGRYLYAEFQSGQVISFVFDGTKATMRADLTADLNMNDTLGNPVSFGEDLAGELYLTSINKGKVFRIDPK